MAAFRLLRFGILSTVLHPTNFSSKLRTLANKVVNSPTIKEDLATSCEQEKIKPKLMIRDVSTRWNSTAELIQRALEIKGGLNILVVKAEHNRRRGVRLARFKLSPEEWMLLEQLSPLLDVRLFLPFSIFIC